MNLKIEVIKRMAIYRKWYHSGLSVQEFVNRYQPEGSPQHKVLR